MYFRNGLVVFIPEEISVLDFLNYRQKLKLPNVIVIIMSCHTYEEIVNLDNLLEAWKEFVRGKRGRRDVQEFQQDLMHHVIALHRDLADKTYKHSAYQAFNISDPKPRRIHKASVRDRLLHHAIYRQLYPYFEKRFISNSFSCRLGKGTHKGFVALEHMARKVSKNYTKQCHVLKCDIRQFFASIDHDILIDILNTHIQDKDFMWLLTEIIESFNGRERTLFNRKGLPLGNLTSQLFTNVYMNVFDQFVKHKLKAKYYARYTDDFVFVSSDKDYLESLVPKIRQFLKGQLALDLHPHKVTIRSIHQGADFLGYVTRPHYRVVRTRTQRRMTRGFSEKLEAYKAGDASQEEVEQSLASYIGVLSHANAYRFTEELNRLWLSEK